MAPAARDVGKSIEDSARGAFAEPAARDMTSDSAWDEMDYWYDKHLDSTNPAAQIANPSCLALISFAITTILLQGPSTGWAEESMRYLAAPFMVVFGGAIQLCAGMWEFARNNMFAGTALSSYGGFWISLGFYFIATAGGIIPESGVHGLQMAFSLAGLFNFGYFVCACGLNVALCFLFFFLTTFNFLAAGGQADPTGTCSKVSGYFGVAAGACGLYIAFAELANETLFRGRTVVPLGAFTWPLRLHQARMRKQRSQKQQV